MTTEELLTQILEQLKIANQLKILELKVETNIRCETIDQVAGEKK